jgi:uncharacterized protein YodC (DUF2158 family)
MSFQPGTIVQLKSGGPAMTVAAVDKDGVRCLWHADSTGQIHTATIPTACLDELVLDDDEEDLDED